MVKAIQYRIYPTREQKEAMMVTFGCARVVYNACLDAYNRHYTEWKEGGKVADTFDNSLPLVSELKKDMPWLAKADSLALGQARLNFMNALDAFYKSRSGERKGRKVGFPKHKKRGKARFSYTTANQGNNIRFDQSDRHIKLPKLGWVRCVKHRPLPDGGVIKRVYVSMTKSEEFYVTLNVECTYRLPLINKVYNIGSPRVVGLDMSLQRFCVSSDPSDDAITKYVREYRREERTLARLERRMSRRKPTVEKDVDGRKVRTEAPRHRKARLRYARKCEKVARRRREFCIRMARYFAMKYDVVCIEDIDMQSMSRSLRLGKSVMDLGWGMFRRWLNHECEKYDTVVYMVDRWYPSSKTCHCCGHVNRELTLSDREWTCPNCGATVDRDRNAALNLRDCFMKDISTDGTSGINASGDSTSTLRGTVERVLSLKQEARGFSHG